VIAPGPSKGLCREKKIAGWVGNIDRENELDVPYEDKEIERDIFLFDLFMIFLKTTHKNKKTMQTK
jgi:hypothetical protein